MERILRQLTQNVGAEAKALLASLEIFTTLDVICARALLAQEQHAVRPMLVLSGGRRKLRRARHPLLPKDTVVPLNVQLGDKFTMLLITGPNTGGKTVALKAVGLFCADGADWSVYPRKQCKKCRCSAQFMRISAMSRALSRACQPSLPI